MTQKFSCFLCSERGSFFVAAALFMFVFLGVSTFAVDISRYYKKKQKLQDIADGAALAGGQALNQFKDNPEEQPAYTAVLNYINSTQGDDYVDLYEVHSPTNIDGVWVERFGGSPDTSCAEFTISDDESIVTGEPVDVNSQVLGSAVTDQYGGRDYPVTAKVNVSDSEGNDTTIEPWGGYDQPNQANLNNEEEKPSIDLSNYPEGTEITADGRLYYPDGGPYSGYSIYGEKSSSSPEVMTLQDGDTPPEIEGGFDQASVAEYVEDLVDPATGKISLQKNQAIMCFELTHDADDPSADFQDLILLLTMTPNSGSGTGGGGSGASYSYSTTTSKCSVEYGTNFYRVGVQVYGKFEPYFWPKNIFGRETSAVSTQAVAEVHPRRVYQSQSDPLDCGIYSGGQMTLSGNNFDADGVDFCSNSNIDAGGSNNGTMGDIFLLESAMFSPPGGSSGTVENFSPARSMPQFQATNPGAYDVDLSNYDSWSDLGECGGSVDCGPNDGSSWSRDCDNNGDCPSSCECDQGPGYDACVPKSGGGAGGSGKALRTSGNGSADVVWESGGSAVCVEKSGGGYTLGKNQGGKIQEADGSPVTIYADGDVTFTESGKAPGTNNGLNGGLYTTGDFTVAGNNYEFVGDKSSLGGLAVWAEGDVDFQKNNVTVEGITGAGGNYSFSSNGGGKPVRISGVLVSGGEFEFNPNSNNTKIEFAPSKFDSNYLDVGGWSTTVQRSQGRPLYSQVKVRLIH